MNEQDQNGGARQQQQQQQQQQPNQKSYQDTMTAKQITQRLEG